MIGTNIKALRLYAGLTQVQLAEELGTSQKYVSSIEAGQKKLSIASLKKLREILEQYFNVKYEHILDRPPKYIRVKYPKLYIE